MASQPEEKPNRLKKALEVIAYPLSGFVGGFYGHSSVRDHSYNNLKNAGIFSAGRNQRNTEIAEAIRAGTPQTVPDKIAEADAKYSTYIDKTFIEKGYSNMWTRFKHLHKNQKLEAVMTAFTAGGITLGVVLTVLNSKGLLGKLSTSKSETDKSPSP